MSKGRIPPQIHRLHDKARKAEKARLRAEALAERRRAKSQAGEPPAPDPVLDPSVITPPTLTSR